MSELSSAAQWSVFAALTVLLALALVFWIKYLPKLRQYRFKRLRLDGINRRYVQLCKARKDVVYHYFWAVDRGDTKEADVHEERVLDIDRQLGEIRGEYKLANM